MTTPSPLLRTRGGHEAGRVTYIELFFDLVFVFAVTQLSHSLIEHFSWHGAVETLLMLLAVWWAWIYTSWVTNWLDPAKVAVRVALLALMLLGLILSASIPQAFETRGLVFAGAYVALQCGRCLFFLWAVRGQPGLVANFQRILVWFLASAVFWLLGATQDGSARLACWAIAAVLEFSAALVYFRVPGLGRATVADWNVDGAHLAERCALFMIIALGESILVTGATFAGMPWSAGTTTAFLASFIGSIAMWWLYFDATAEAGAAVIAHARDPGRLARLSYTYLHLFLVAGVILSAVGDEFVLAHAGDIASGKTLVAVLGGAALFLLGIALFKWSITGRMPVSPYVAIIALLLMIPLQGRVPQLVVMLATVVVLVSLAGWDAWEAKVRRRCPPAG